MEAETGPSILAAMSSGGPSSGGPIFLAGVDRSGIGLLCEVLESHRHVSMTRRTDFWSNYARRLGDLADRAGLDRALVTMMRDSRMRVLEPDVDRLHLDMAAGPATPARLFELLQVQLMERRGCSRWGDKSLGAERHAELILSSYPAARIVHVLRDPRDRYASHKLHRGLGGGGLGSATALGRWSARLASINEQRFDGRYLVVRYEDLVTDPEPTLLRISKFLDLDPRDGEHALPGEAEPLPLTTASVGRFHDDISRPERRFIELLTRNGMARWGYEGTDHAMSRAAAFRFWCRVVPRQTIYATLWRPRMALRESRGRGPSRHRLTEV